MTDQKAQVKANGQDDRNEPSARLCAVGGLDCGRQKKLWGGMCRAHKFYADAPACIEEGCDIRPTAEANKFVKGRCPKHDQQFRAAAKRAAQGSCRVGENCGPQSRLIDGLCRKHWTLLGTFGSFEVPVCEEPDCEVSADTDPSGSFKAGRCNMHYLRLRRAIQRAEELGDRLCLRCGKDMSTGRRNAKYCSNECMAAASNERNIEEIRMRGRLGEALRKALKLHNEGSEPFTTDEAVALLERLGFRCTYCGGTFEPSEMHLDHIVPLRRGGPHALYNITAACWGCNGSKKDRPLLLEWAPPLLGGKPRRDPTAPRGRRRNPWVPGQWRDEHGPLPSVLALASEHPELLRAIQVTEKFFRNQGQEAERAS
ncbi:HNH endonuclease [Arthrobacter zhaoguopingii]|uniref:HNH endonuclease n=1 Tax=Arthrobacter zhaoguopingii TaxID=2681491 RepID=UPI00135863EE|nr:HNH endonuclease signature motif containing protein [Arthrobacter zhaoguopingii]